jgi:hypothetical protein
MSKENMKTCMGIFCTFMEDKHNFVIKGDEITELKKIMFSIMNSINDSPDSSGSSIHEMNMIVLSKTKDIYISNMSKHKPNIKSLDREREIYGNRDVSINELIPKRDPYIRKQGEDINPTQTDNKSTMLNKLVDERESLFQREIPDITKLGRQIKESAEHADDFMKRLKYFEEERGAIDIKFSTSTPPPEPKATRFDVDKEIHERNNVDAQDPKVLYKFDDSDMFKTHNRPVDDDIMTSRQQLLIPLPSAKGTGTGAGTGEPGTPGAAGEASRYHNIQKYISINSIDREWVNDIKRYSYSVTFNSDNINGSYKNIRSIEVGKVIIPEEISETINILNLPNKTQFNYEFSFSYPYLILRIEEFNDVYDGTNDNVRKSFCKLVYHRSYKAPNGRGYVILKPLQKEKKYFYPSPLSLLNRLTISVLKPNGFLLNDSNDSYKLFKLDYDPFNPNFFQVVTDVFFDKNEFYVGDVILVKNFIINSTAQPVQAKRLTDYINKPDGHEILQIGSTNNNGFWRSFYIKAIGTFDKINGKFDTDTDIVNCLNTYNDTINYNTYTGFNGNILNTSLQNTIGMSIDTLVNSTSHIDTMLV